MELQTIKFLGIEFIFLNDNLSQIKNSKDIATVYKLTDCLWPLVGNFLGKTKVTKLIA